MWVRWRIYRVARKPMRWHRLEPEDRYRTLCGRRFTRHDYLETQQKLPKPHDRCAHCERAKRPSAG